MVSTLFAVRRKSARGNAYCEEAADRKRGTIVWDSVMCGLWSWLALQHPHTLNSEVC